MTRMTLDAAASERLRSADCPVELCDPDGNIIGRFVPRTPIPPDLVCPTPVEELERREREDPRLTTQQVLEMLRED